MDKNKLIEIHETNRLFNPRIKSFEDRVKPLEAKKSFYIQRIKADKQELKTLIKEIKEDRGMALKLTGQRDELNKQN